MIDKEIKQIGYNIVNGIDMDERLTKEAKLFDSRIIQFKKNNIERYYYQVKDFFRLFEHSSIAQENVDDNKKMPFAARLEEMKTVAKINLVIQDIFMGGTDNSRAKEMIKKAMLSTNENKAFVAMTQTRLEVLEDLLWIIRGEPTNYFDDKLYLVDVQLHD